MENTVTLPQETITEAVRVFRYEDDVFPDTAPHLPTEAILKHYSMLKPELINGTVTGPTINEKQQLEYEFKLQLGEKG